MSLAAGISVSEDLVAQFALLSREGGSRFLQVIIADESTVTVKNVVEAQGGWEEDFDLTTSVLEEKEACYILYRTDNKTLEGRFEFYLLRYVPDKAPVRHKMMYASTVSTLKRALGGSVIVEDIFGTTPGDINTAGYKDFVKHKSAAIPLTDSEIQAKEEREEGVFVGGGGAGMGVHGVNFPVDPDVNECLADLKAGNLNYVQLDVDIENEKIVLSDAQKLDISEVAALIPTALPCFHFFVWDHVHEGQNLSSLIYIYSSPDGSNGTTSAPVKHRMLYSSSKAHVASLVTAYGFTIDGKMEIGSPSEFSEDDASRELHPPKIEKKKKFAKPRPQGGRRLNRK
eukprot:TRINITY_DN5259_c0_g1_i1.p1 TRINITY_DN5259_c0_g1~~TRINITY_DN5259_c0_g1_i1.p1  ORF type:complete len:362 (-),score=84.47 TRINITY_DN5259_c0_g1_i1:106-1131(-)